MPEPLKTEAEVIRALAQRVMGWKLTICPADSLRFFWYANDIQTAFLLRSGELGGRWNPLRSIADAHELLERFTEAAAWAREGNEHAASVCAAGKFYEESADSFCLAACRAALASIGLSYEPEGK